MRILGVAVLSLAGAAHAQPFERVSGPLPEMAVTASSTESMDHTVAAFYVIPRDVAYEPAVHARLVQATRDVQAWYQCATAGLTYEIEFPETVRVYFGQQTRQEYADAGWYNPILSEMAGAGLPVFYPGTVAALWSRGAGWFAGANPACEGHCGVAMVGVEVFPEFNRPEWSGGACPAGTGGAAFPCTPLGAFAHELGHALASLPHPADAPATQAVAGHSVMQTHWNFPTYAAPGERPWGFLTVERDALEASPFLKGDFAVRQKYGCAVVNLPAQGGAPRPRFWVERTDGLTVFLANAPLDAARLSWTFGDGESSQNAGARVVHTYAKPGTYTITLRASTADQMVKLVRREVTVP